MSNSLPEPRPVAPVAAGGLRASDADRDHVATVLSTAYAEGRLSRDEHDERLEQVLGAKTFDDLIPITSDLVPVGVAPVQAAAVAPTDVAYSIDRSQESAPDRMIGIFGGATRNGRWRVPKQSQAFALFGGVDLDLREAIFESDVVEITGFWCFGGMEIKVPEGVEVIDRTAGIFGGTDVSDLGVRQPGAPTLVIKGVSLFGGVSVKGPKPAKKKRR